jgi:hypothetical protein
LIEARIVGLEHDVDVHAAGDAIAGAALAARVESQVAAGCDPIEAVHGLRRGPATAHLPTPEGPANSSVGGSDSRSIARAISVVSADGR